MKKNNRKFIQFMGCWFILIVMMSCGKKNSGTAQAEPDFIKNAICVLDNSSSNSAEVVIRKGDEKSKVVSQMIVPAKDKKVILLAMGASYTIVKDNQEPIKMTVNSDMSISLFPLEVTQVTPEDPVTNQVTPPVPTVGTQVAVTGNRIKTPVVTPQPQSGNPTKTVPVATVTKGTQSAQQKQPTERTQPAATEAIQSAQQKQPAEGAQPAATVPIATPGISPPVRLKTSQAFIIRDKSRTVSFGRFQYFKVNTRDKEIMTGAEIINLISKNKIDPALVETDKEGKVQLENITNGSQIAIFFQDPKTSKAYIKYVIIDTSKNTQEILFNLPNDSIQRRFSIKLIPSTDRFIQDSISAVLEYRINNESDLNHDTYQSFQVPPNRISFPDSKNPNSGYITIIPDELGLSSASGIEFNLTITGKTNFNLTKTVRRVDPLINEVWGMNTNEMTLEETD
jgi:hypothetical protein